MCETCGCGDPEVVPVEVQESLLAGNDLTAAHNREHFRRDGVPDALHERSTFERVEGNWRYLAAEA